MKYQIILFVVLFCIIQCDDDDIPIKEYEIKHIEVMRNNSAECALFLKKDSSFPLKKPGKVVLVGAGARQTTKGGTGSGDVNSRYFTTCEEGLENAGFEIVSKDWLDEFPKFKEERHSDFTDYIKNVADQLSSNAGHISFGAVEPEREYELPLEFSDVDTAFYVVRRNSGEGEDRRLVKGDIYLTNSEVRDILYLNEEYKNFMLVLNVAGVVDLSPVKDVKNILLLSQLGVVTGDIFADIVLGKVNPSGKLSTTWAAVKDYKYIEEFGGIDNTRYLEGVYVGYRYFDSVKVAPLFPFGYGLSYTSFKLEYVGIKNNKDEFTVRIKVTNSGKVDGKEVVQIYLSPSQTNKDKPYQSLVAFKKTPLLEPEGSADLNITFKLSDNARFDEETAQYILDKGHYIIRMGNSSNKTKAVAYITLPEDIETEVLKNVGGKPDFKDFRPKIKYEDDLEELDEIILEKKDFKKKRVDYDNYRISFNQNLMTFSNAELARMCVGHFTNEGEERKERHVEGEAGETTLALEKVDKFLVLADGPAGLRITKRYEKEENGVNKVYYQYTTAIPTATALAQSFNEELLEKIGNVVGNEMDIFHVHLWLAPALNIHRNILNGRNFEYYSEDPLLSGKMSAAITRGVQKHANRGTTIKHFACNGQEMNRFNSNSILSERALREIYLKGFKISVEESNPVALMTSYNLINGKHSSARRDLLVDVLRIEWGYTGLIMSDWYTSNQIKIGIANHPAQHDVPNIIGGNNLQMGGGKNDYDLIMKSVEEGNMNTINLLECASKVYDTIELLNK